MYKVKLNPSLSIKDIIICFVLVIVLGIFCYTYSLDINPLIFIAGLVVTGVLEFITCNELVVSDLIINPSSIELIYKKNGKIVKKLKIKKSDILSFYVCANITEQFRKIIETNCKFDIHLKNGDKIFFVVKSSASDIKPSRWFVSTFQPLINIAKAQYKYKIPNFSCEIIGSVYVKGVVEHYLKYGKCSFWQNTIIQYNSSDEEKFVIIFIYGAIALMFSMLVIFAIYLFLSTYL